jgi:hypothetical protein
VLQSLFLATDLILLKKVLMSFASMTTPGVRGCDEFPEFREFELRVICCSPC